MYYLYFYLESVVGIAHYIVCPCDPFSFVCSLFAGAGAGAGKSLLFMFLGDGRGGIGFEYKEGGCG